MAYDLSEINFKTVSDPRGLIEEGDAIYHANVETAAEKIAGLSAFHGTADDTVFCGRWDTRL